jgi:hypothetical protein
MATHELKDGALMTRNRHLKQESRALFHWANCPTQHTIATFRFFLPNDLTNKEDVFFVEIREAFEFSWRISGYLNIKPSTSFAFHYFLVLCELPLWSSSLS